MSLLVNVSVTIGETTMEGPLIVGNYTETVVPNSADDSIEDIGALIVNKAEMLMQQGKETILGQMDQVVTMVNQAGGLDSFGEN